MTIPTVDRATRFGYVRPASLSEALAVLAERAPAVRALAGGTDLLVEFRGHTSGSDTLVDIGRLEELRGVELRDGGLWIGAGTTHTDLLRSALVQRHAPAMVAAARATGSVQIRNLGTIGGNLCSAVPAMDGGPVLLALDADVSMMAADRRRRLSLEQFFTGPHRTALEPGELLISIEIPRAMVGRPQAFWKFGLRKGQALALVNAAASVGVAADGSLVDPRLVLGAVAPTVIRARTAEQVLAGERTGAGYERRIGEAAEAAVADAAPIDDFRASAAYRRELIRAGITRVVKAAVAEAARRVGEG